MHRTSVVFRGFDRAFAGRKPLSRRHRCADRGIPANRGVGNRTGILSEIIFGLWCSRFGERQNQANARASLQAWVRQRLGRSSCVRSNRLCPWSDFSAADRPTKSAAVAAAFRQGLGQTGFTVGQNVAIEYRWAEGHYDRLPALAAELVNLKWQRSLPPAVRRPRSRQKRRHRTIPVIFSAADDPVGLGLVASLSRPGGNVTGMSLFNADLGAKRLALLHELVPSAGVVAYLTESSQSERQARGKGGARSRKDIRC